MLKSVHEGTFTEGATHLSNSHPPMLGRQSLKSNKGASIPKIFWANLCPSVAHSRKCKDGVGTALHSPINHSCEMHAKKGKRWIRDRIDQIPTQPLAARSKLIVLAAKGNNSQIRLTTGELTDPITKKPAINEVTTLYLSPCEDQSPQIGPSGVWCSHRNLVSTDLKFRKSEKSSLLPI